MAVIDKVLEFSDNQDIGSVSSGSSVVSSVVPELFNATAPYESPYDTWGTDITPDIGNGGRLIFNIHVSATLAGSSAAVVATLVSKAADNSISSTGTTHATITIPTLTAAGTMYSVHVPAGTINRFVGVLYTASGGSLTSGNFDAWLGLDVERYSAT